MNSLTSIPPQITQCFDKNLLSRPGIGHWDEPEYLRNKYRGIPKYPIGSRGWKEIQEILKVYEELYEWQLAQKAYNKATEKEILERPSLPIEAILRLNGFVGKNVRNAFSSAFPGCLKSYEIQKVQR